jgi:hypothetical protein
MIAEKLFVCCVVIDRHSDEYHFGALVDLLV